MSEETTKPEAEATPAATESQTSAETPAPTPKIDLATVVSKVEMCDNWVTGALNKLLGLVGDHPWENWIAVANKYIGMFLPALIAVSGVLAWLLCLILMIKEKAPFTMVLASFGILLATAFSMHLAPKALALARSFVEKGEAEAVRPELLHILKVLLGLGGIITAIYLLLQFDSSTVVPAIEYAIVAVLAIIVCSRPAIAGMKEGYPTNGVEEAITILLLPVRVVLSLLSLLIGIATVAAFVYGFVLLFKEGLISFTTFAGAAVVPFLLPFFTYLIFLLVMFILDFYRALVSIPRKLDELKK